MKRFFILCVILAVLFCSCEPPTSPDRIRKDQLKRPGESMVMVVK